MYANEHARFTAVDASLTSGKSANPQTFNRFVYCLNNPLVLSDPGGLQVGVATGKVYINRAQTQVRIFLDGKVRSGFIPLDHNIDTTTTVRGILHTMSVTPTGWTIGNRVDGAMFAAAPQATAVQGDANIGAFLQGFGAGMDDIETGLKTGAKNAPIDLANELTGALWIALTNGNGLQNPLQIERYGYPNARAASWGDGFADGLNAAPAVALPALASDSLISAVPEISQAATSSRLASSTAPADTGYYLLRFESDKFYAGKGPISRMNQSASSLSRTYSDPVTSREFFPASSNKEAFMGEHTIMMENGGPLIFDKLSPTYNKIHSPGCRFFCQ